ncbi:hypothetical protein [Bacillus sp. 165]|uniref:hypothetical protein n=1 Tax=Bacillus sp. 165 TaxID=1529117 RepID=UPI001ADD38F6|nr:hypothetical protein [Bacillus sp. 165]MBO9131139.1 hypothetical protein [Bacillus sp. 165]
MREEFVDNRYLTDMLSVVLSFDKESIKQLSPEQQIEVFRQLESINNEFNRVHDQIG